MGKKSEKKPAPVERHYSPRGSVAEEASSGSENEPVSVLIPGGKPQESASKRIRAALPQGGHAELVDMARNYICELEDSFERFSAAGRLVSSLSISHELAMMTSKEIGPPLVRALAEAVALMKEGPLMVSRAVERLHTAELMVISALPLELRNNAQARAESVRPRSLSPFLQERTVVGDLPFRGKGELGRLPVRVSSPRGLSVAPSVVEDREESARSRPNAVPTLAEPSGSSPSGARAPGVRGVQGGVPSALPRLLESERAADNLSKWFQQYLSEASVPPLCLHTSPDSWLSAVHSFGETYGLLGDAEEKTLIMTAVRSLPNDLGKERRVRKELGFQALREAERQQRDGESLFESFVRQVRAACRPSTSAKMEDWAQYYSMALQPGMVVQNFIDKRWELGRSLGISDEENLKIACLCLGSERAEDVRKALDDYVAVGGSKPNIVALKALLTLENVRFGLTREGKLLEPRTGSERPAKDKKAPDDGPSASSKKTGPRSCYKCRAPWVAGHVCPDKGSQAATPSGSTSKSEGGKAPGTAGASALSGPSGGSAAQAGAGSRDRPKAPVA
jgi:hypothetical protein